MDKKYIEEMSIDTKYLRDKLTDEEIEEFEVYLLENPEMVDQLELDGVFVKEITALNDFASPDPHNFFTKAAGWLAHLTNKTQGAKIISTSSIALVFGLLIGSWLSTTQLNGYSLELIEFEINRGAEQPARLSSELVVTSSGLNFFSQNQFALVLDSGNFKQDTFRIEIKTQNKKREFVNHKSIKGIRSNQEGTVIVPLLVRSFPPSNYLIQMTSISTPANTKGFNLSVVQEK